MDYTGIIKRAWDTTWRYKILWLFGLFAGAGTSFSSNSDMRGFSNGSSSSGGYDQQFLVVALIIALIVLVLALVYFVLSFAAQGGLIHLVNEAQEGRPVRGGDGWRTGFRYWGRVFLIGLILGLPLLVFLLVIFAVFGASIWGIVAGAIGLDGGRSSGAALSALGAGVFGVCCGGLIMFVVMVAYALVVGVVSPLSLRYGVLRDMTAWAAIKQAWADLRGKRGGMLMLLLLMAIGIGYGIVMAIVLSIFMVPAALLLIAGNWVAAALLLLVGVLVAAVPNAVYSAFQSSAWTIFFRRMTGVEPLKLAPAYAPAVTQFAAVPPAPVPPTPPAEAAEPAAPTEPPVST